MGNETAALFRTLTLGVYVVGVAHGEQRDAFTAAWIMQVSFEPLLLVLSINPQHASYPLLRKARTFAVTVLKRGQLDIARHFGTKSGRDVDKLASFPWRRARSGAPVLQDGLAYFDCEVMATMKAGDHELVLGRVVDGRILDPGGALLMYAETGDMDGSSALYPAAL